MSTFSFGGTGANTGTGSTGFSLGQTPTPSLGPPAQSLQRRNSIASTPSFNQPSAQPQNLLFGKQPTTSSGGFGSATQTAPAFGSNQSSTSSGLFSNNTNSTQSTNSFGVNTQPSQQTQASSIFGAPTTQPSQASPLFGGAPTTQASQAPSMFGGAQAPKPSLFGGPTNQNTSMFGTNTSSPSPFSQAQPTQQNSLFGSAQPQQQQSGFGAQQQPGFGAQQQQTGCGPQQQQSGFGASQGSAIFGASFANNSMQPQLRSSINEPSFSMSGSINPSRPLGALTTPRKRTDSLLGSTAVLPLGPSTPSSARRTSSFKSSPSARLLLSANRSSPYTVAPYSARKDRFAVSNSSLSRSRSDFNLGQNAAMGLRSERSINDFRAIPKPSVPASDRFNSIKRLVISRSSRTLTNIIGRNSDREQPQNGSNGITNGSANTNGHKPSNSVSTSNDFATPSSLRRSATRAEVNPAANTAGYWIYPTLADLYQMPRSKLASLDGLVIGRHGYGQIEYAEPVDLTQTNLSDILGNLVVFGRNTVCVYPDEATKAPPGHALNKAAVVSLEGVFAMDRKRNVPVKDPVDPRLIKHKSRLRQAIESKGGQFLTFDLDTGLWVFRVPHFSVWGLPGDEDDDDFYDEIEVEPVETAAPVPQPPLPPAQPVFQSAAEPILAAPPAVQRNLIDHSPELLPQVIRPTKLESPFKDIFDPEGKQLHTPPLFAQFRKDSTSANEPIEAKPENVEEATQNAGIWAHEEPQGLIGLPEDDDMSTGGTFTDSDNEASQLIVPDNLDKTEMVSSMSWIDLLRFSSRADSPLAKSQVRPALEQIEAETDDSPLTAWQLDQTLFGGLSSLKTTNVAQYREAAEKLRRPDMFDPMSFAKFCGSRLLVKSTHSLSGIAPRSIHTTSRSLLSVSDLKPKTTIVARANGLPLATPSDEMTFEFVASRAIDKREREMWELASILFDDLALLGLRSISQNLPPHVQERIKEQHRRECISLWLQEVVVKGVEIDLEKGSGPLDALVAHLTGHAIQDASITAMMSNNFHLATVIPLLGSDDKTIQSDAKNQLEDWKRNKAIFHIPLQVRRVFELLSGNVTISEATSAAGEHIPALYLCEGLDWKRAFGLHLWYGSSKRTPISEVVEKYTQAFEDPGSKTASPALEDGSLDILYRLLKLYGSMSPSLASVLEATRQPLSYRQAWLLHTVLVHALRQFSDPAGKHGDQLCANFGLELESSGKWVEALFVYSHMRNDDAAKRNIERVLSLHVPELSIPAVREQLRDLGIPESSMFEAKALKALADGNYLEMTDNLIQAKLWEEAHRIIVSRVAPKAVIEERHSVIVDLLARIEAPHAIFSWHTGGQMYLDYAELVRLVSSGEGSKEQISKIAQRLSTSLCDVQFGSNKDVKVAVALMSAFVGAHAAADLAGSKVLQMKMDENQYVGQTLTLSVDYFRSRLELVR